MEIKNIYTFFYDIAQDFKVLCQNPHPAPRDPKEMQNLRDQRMESLVLRVLGIIVLAIAANAFISAAIIFTAEPLNAIIPCLCSIFLFAAAHDFLVMGCNSRDAIKQFDRIGNGLWNTVAGVVNLVNMAGRQTITGIPAVLRGTWIIEPLLIDCF